MANSLPSTLPAAPPKSARFLARLNFLPTRRWRRYSRGTFYLFISPWVIGFLALTLIPLLYALLLSFTNFDGLSGHWHWIGLRNYVELWHTPAIWSSLGRTLFYLVLVVPLGLLGSLALALLLNQRLRAIGVFRTLFYLPSVVPVVATAIMWKLIFARDNGPLNAILAAVHIPAIGWLLDPTAFYALLIVVLWGLGGGMIIILAGLQGIPTELREAALVDGANEWQTLRHVTLPLLSPVLFFQLITSVIFALQTFIQPIVLSQSGGDSEISAGNVPQSTHLIIVQVFQEIFVNDRFGYGSALLWIFLLLVMVITLVLLGTSRLWVYYEVDRNQ